MKWFVGILLLCLLFVTNTSFFGSSYSKTAYYVVVDKSDYELKVYDGDGWLITYPVVFGNDDLGDKLVQGDRKTPEGTFTIVSKKMHSKWSRYLGIDYPIQESVDLFNRRKQSGQIPAHAKIGGDIGIHGTWPREGFAVDQYQNWTMGCISMKNEHVVQFYNMVPIGTRITIRK
jgi:murein L,D-transpeptidase YafK